MYRQQGLIEQLERGYDQLRQRIQTDGEGGSGSNPADEKPPHY